MVSELIIDEFIDSHTAIRNPIVSSVTNVTKPSDDL